MCARQPGGAAAVRSCPDIAVRHLPLHACALGGGAFVLPAAGGAAEQARVNGGVAGFCWPGAPGSGPGAAARPGCRVRLN